MQTYKPIPGAEVLFPSGREVVGRCPRCGAEVTESPKGFFCENRTCSFVLWKNSRFFTAKKKVLTKSLAAALLKNGRAPLKGCYSEKTGMFFHIVTSRTQILTRVEFCRFFSKCLADSSCHSPVSYTHLDVYKRQLPSSRSGIRSYQLSADACHVPERCRCNRFRCSSRYPAGILNVIHLFIPLSGLNSELF